MSRVSRGGKTMTISINWGAPGCGKTHKLISEFLQCEYPSRLLTTFSRSTADDIKNKSAQMMDIDPETLKQEINTIHGTCYKLIGGRAYGKVVTNKVLKEFNRETGYNFKLTQDTPDTDNGCGVLDCYSWMQNTDTTLNDVDNYPSFRKLNLAPSDVREQIKHYSEWKENNGLIDFTDMLSIVLKSGLCPAVDLLLVDEFQDLTALPNKIFYMWCNDIEEVIISGDPLQSIYGFMGGAPDYFNNLSGIKKTLPISYRLSKPMWDYAVAVAEDAGMVTPDIQTSSHDGHIKHISYRDYVNDVTGWEGNIKHTIFHLIRGKYQAPAICQIMAENGIIWNGLGGWTETQFNILNSIIRVRNGNALYKPHLEALVKVYPQELFNYIGSKKDLLEYIKIKINSELPGESGGLITPALYRFLMSDDPTIDMIGVGKLTRLKIAKALRNHTKQVLPHDTMTHVLTIHASKGLAADRVYLHTGISANTKKAMRIDPAAEARVFYVGITRTKKELFLVKDKGVNYPLPVGAS